MIRRQLPTRGQRIMYQRKVKIVCAWCGRHIKGHPGNLDVSHAICPGCSAFMLADAGYPPDNPVEEGVELGGEG